MKIILILLTIIFISGCNIFPEAPTGKTIYIDVKTGKEVPAPVKEKEIPSFKKDVSCNEFGVAYYKSSIIGPVTAGSTVSPVLWLDPNLGVIQYLSCTKYKELASLKDEDKK
jgi:hypothetical protein